MKYDFKIKNRIYISGTPDEIRLLIKELSDHLDNGAMYTQLKNKLDNLEKIVEPEKYFLGLHHTISYSRNSFTYVPSVSSKTGQEFHYSVFKKLFDEATRDIKFKKLK